jgi:tetratricopeptide (TPR) repeat protein
MAKIRFDAVSRFGLHHLRNRYSARRWLCSVTFWFALLGPISVLHAQFGPLPDPAKAPQAKSQEELDAYLEIVDTTAAQKLVAEVNVFASRFPDSQLLGIAYQYQMHAFQQLGDLDGTLAAGQKALRGNPSDLNTLLTLAAAMANAAAQRPDRAALLGQAEAYASQALTTIEQIHPPHQTSLERWDLEKRTMQCNAHEALGVAAIDRADFQTAIHELETAIALQPSPDGARFFRLGVAYAAQGKRSEADKNFRRAVDLGPELVRKLASQELEKLAKNGPAPQ